MATFTTSDLLTSIRIKAFLPPTGGAWSTDDLLRVASEAMDEVIVPAIMSCNEEYFVTQTDVALTANQQGYRVPSQAIGGKLRDVTYIDASGVGTSMNRIPLELIDSYAQAGSAYPQGWAPAFAVQRNQILVAPTPATTQGTMRLRYFRRPGRLVATSSAFALTGVAGTVVSGAVPASFTTALTYDFIQQASQFDWLYTDQSISALSPGVSITTSTALTGLTNGDWVAIAGESPVPQIPVEFHQCLAQAAAVKILEALAYLDKMQAAQAKLDASIRAAQMLITPRVDGEPQKIVNRNGTLTRGWRFWR